MTHLHDIVDPALLAVRRAEGYVAVRPHPDDADLLIWNYTNKTQFDNAWDAATEQCRGLITRQGEIIARPFRKFFNLGQLDAIPAGEFDAYEKMDGSLGIIYEAPDGIPAVATRGSFASEQALWATEFLRDDPLLCGSGAAAIRAGQTMLVEIIYPANRIVVDYGKRADLTWLATIDNATGADTFDAHGWYGPVAQHYPGLDLDAITAMQRDNAEGFVLRWRSCGTRAKVKFEEYQRLHKILTGVSEKTIWELLSNHQSLDRLIELVPDEFYDWVRSVETTLNAQFTEIEQSALATLADVDLGASRKEQAASITTSAYPGIVFSMLDQKPYAHKIWQMIRPVAAKPFRADVDA